METDKESLRSKRIFVAGHRGLVGSAIVRALRTRGCEEILTRSRSALDLTDAVAVADFFARERPDHVYLAAAKVGGIQANASYPADFLRDNLLIQTHVIHQAWAHGAERLLFLGSSCIYPRLAPQPIREEHLLSGPLEPTNEPYAIAKIAGIKLCESYNRQHGTDFRSLMPSNLYGPGDNYHPENSHVIPALIRRFHEAKMNGADTVILWGSGTPLREFLFVDDLADACVHVMQLGRALWERHTLPMRSHVNVGSGEEISIRELAARVAEVVGFTGRIETDPDKPDGTPRKRLDSTLLARIGFAPKVSLREGLARTYADFLEHGAAGR